MKAPDEQRIWRAVIMRALQDAIWTDRNPTGKRSERVSFFGAILARETATRMRDEAAFWILTNEKDFNAVCEMAGLTPAVVRRGAQRAMEASHEQKAYWTSNGFLLSDVWGDGELRNQG